MIKNKKEVLNVFSKVLQKRTDYVVLGLSGGVDSTVLACICVKALGADNVYTYGMPYSKADWIKFNANAENVAENLKIHYKTIPVNDTVEGYKDIIDFDLSENNLAELISRIRTNTLYIQNNALHEVTGRKGIVLGTSNYTELFVGNHILGGDALGDLFVLGELYKSEVYELAEYFRQKKMINSAMIDAHPSSGLYGDKTTFDMLGYTHEQIEVVIKDWYEYVAKPKEKDITQLYQMSDIHKTVMDMYFRNKHKYPVSKIVPIRYLIKCN